jgi:hypothetical protein
MRKKRYSHAEAMELCNAMPWFGLDMALGYGTKRETLEALRARVIEYGGCRWSGLSHKETMDAHKAGCDTYALSVVRELGAPADVALAIAKGSINRWGNGPVVVPRKGGNRWDDDLLELAVEAAALYPEGAEVIAGLVENWESTAEDLALAARTILREPAKSRSPQRKSTN